MKKPQPKDYGFDTEYQTWPDKVKRQKYRHAMSEYQKFLFAQSIDRDQFAIGFAKQVAIWGWRFVPELHEWRLYDRKEKSWNTKGTAELLELYKAFSHP